jgi:two-component system phosphate regulon sensor histidine kinase PhoR
MPDRGWKFHTGRWLLFAAVIVTAGWALNLPAWAALVALALYFLWHAANAWRLQNWMVNPGRKTPESLGIWADIFKCVSSVEQEKNDQIERYQAMIGDFQDLADALPDATLIIDRNLDVTWFNKTAEGLLGLRRPQDFGRPVTNLFPDSDFADWLKKPEEVKERLELPTPGRANSWLNINVVSFRDSQSLIVFRDTSEVHNVERIRRDFVTNISHELRTPLTVMRGYLELLQDQPIDDMTDAIERMNTQAFQMQAMLDDLLDLSRLQDLDAPGEEESVDVPALLLQLREQAEEISRGRHEIHFDIDDSLHLSGIKSDIESAFRNLITNSLKYTPDGGTISINWHEQPAGPTLSVADTGIGIPAREIPRVTERFYRVGSDRGRESGGTGLGLSIVKHVLNAHQARLQIESEAGLGSKFSCIFPPVRKRD